MSSILDSHLRVGKLLSGYLFIGPLAAARENVEKVAIKLFGDDYVLNLDYHEFLEEKFGIDDAREVIRVVALRSAAGGEKIFFLNVNGITIEAANALLKIVEEPPTGTYFFLTTTVAERLPETLQSRLVRIFLPSAPDNARIKKFLSLSLEKRFAEVKKNAERDRGEIEILLAEYEAYLAVKLREDERGAISEIEHFFKLKELFLMPVSYNKAILEGVAITAKK